MSGTDTPAPDSKGVLTTHPLIGVVGVVLGAMVATPVTCLMNSDVSSVWARANFMVSQEVMALGLALAFNSTVGAIILELLDTGALSRPVDVLTFAGFFQITRLFGIEAGAAFMGPFIPVREQFHSNILGSNVQIANGLTSSRLKGLTHAFSPTPLALQQREERLKYCPYRSASKLLRWRSPTVFSS